MASVTFEIGTTPNPNSIRVALSEPLFPKARTFTKAKGGQDDALAGKLLGVAGVVQVFMLNNFISINKEAGVDWSSVEPAVARVLQEHFGA
jgi:hypothetical protein